MQLEVNDIEGTCTLGELAAFDQFDGVKQRKNGSYVEVDEESDLVFLTPKDVKNAEKQARRQQHRAVIANLVNKDYIKLLTKCHYKVVAKYRGREGTVHVLFRDISRVKPY